MLTISACWQRPLLEVNLGKSLIVKDIILPRILRILRQISGSQRDTFIGEDARSRADPSSVRRPIDNGVITNWNDMEKIWDHAIRNELGADPKDHPLFFSEPLGNPMPNREKMIQVVFEHLNSPAFFVNNQAVLSLYAAGRTEGIVVDCGECSPGVVQVSTGFALKYTISRADIAGRGLTDHLAKTLSGRGHSFTTATEKELVRDMKETLCYISTDFEQETQTALQSSSLERSYDLPDGKAITIGTDRFAAPEILFRPELSGHQGDGIHKATLNTIMKVDEDIRWGLCRDIVLVNISLSCYWERLLIRS